VSATTATAPNIEDHTPPLDPIQQPTAHLSSKSDIVELHKINHDEPNEPTANIINICDAPPLVRPKKRLRIIEQRGLLDQFSFSSSSVMIGGAVLAGRHHHVSRQRQSENKNRPRLTKWFLLRPPWLRLYKYSGSLTFPTPYNNGKVKDLPGQRPHPRP